MSATSVHSTNVKEKTDIIGEAEFTINKIAIKLKPLRHSLSKNWKDLANLLNVNAADIMKLNQDMMLDKLRIMDVVQALLYDWIMRESYAATRGRLVQHLRDSEMNDCADILEIWTCE